MVKVPLLPGRCQARGMGKYSWQLAARGQIAECELRIGKNKETGDRSQKSEDPSEIVLTQFHGASRRQIADSEIRKLEN